MMQDKKTGFLVKEGSSKELIEKILLLLNDQKLGSEMGEKGREFVIKTFSWDVIANRFLNYAKNKLKINSK